MGFKLRGRGGQEQSFQGAFIDQVMEIQLTANQNDFAPSYGNVDAFNLNALYLNALTGFSITGLVGGSDGRRVIVAATGAGAVTLVGQDVGSLAANRFTTTVVIPAGSGVLLEYSGSLSRWFVVGGAGGSFGGFGNPTAQIGLTAVNGVATTAMRSDAAPPIDQSIAPTWTGLHLFTAPFGPRINANLCAAFSVDDFGAGVQIVAEQFSMPSGGVDERRWSQTAVASAKTMGIYASSDNGLITATAWEATRNGAVINLLAYGNVVDNPLHQFFGLLRLSSYGAGTLNTDASGNVTATSDSRLKRDVRRFAAGLDAIKGLDPVLYGWTPESGFDQTRNDYAGFLAQEVEAVLPEAVDRMKVIKRTTYKEETAARVATYVAEMSAYNALPANEKESAAMPRLDPVTEKDLHIEYDENAPKSLSDRAILCALVNAVKELSAQVEALKAGR
jgi:hypothetical protein